MPLYLPGMRWWEKLSPDPVVRVPFCEGMLYMKSLGFFPKADSKGKRNYRPVVNEYFERYRAQVPIEFDESAYDVIRDTHEGVNKSVLKYDRPCEPPPGFREDVWAMAVEDTLQDYGFLTGKCVVKDRGEVIIDPNTSPGTVYKWNGCRCKVDGIIDFPEIDKLLWDVNWMHSYPILFKQSGKIELVKIAKINANDIRGFTVSPLDFVMFTARLKQDFDEKLSRFANFHGHNPCKVGMIMQHGGFSRWGAYLDVAPDWLKISEDAVKYDSTWMMRAARVAQAVRLQAHDETSMPIQEFSSRLDYSVEQDIHSCIHLPSGQVVMKDTGLNSGTVATSYDGSMSHTAESHYVVRRVTGLNADPNAYGIMRRKYRFGVYSDDKNSSVHPDWAEMFTFEARAKAYAELGITLDKTKDVSSYSLEGHQWLGKTFKKLDGKYVPVANRNKILCSLRNIEAKMSDEIHLARALSLMVEATFTDCFEWIRGYVLWLLQFIEKPEVEDDLGRWLLSVPTYRQCVRFWLGQESLENCPCSQAEQSDL